MPGRTGLRRALLALAISSIAESSTLVAGAGGPSPPRFGERLVKLGGSPADPAVRAHVAWSEAAGFNGFFVYSSLAGGWSERDAPSGPFLRPDFVAFARAAASRGVRIVLSVNPVADSGGTFVFSERDGARRLARFLGLLRRRAGVREFVLSFDDQPTRLTELRDVVRYGTSAAPAHLDLTRWIERRLERGAALWLAAAAYSDRHLADGSGLYARPFLEGLGALAPRVGIVWTGPAVFSPEITAENLRATRSRLGGRRLLLYDNYPVNDDPGDALGLVLGPLRGRAADLAGVAAAYLACPMRQLAASRLPLATTAAWLADPGAYDPAVSWARAIDRLAGSDGAVREALETQALEWGGWIGEGTWRHRDLANPQAAADALDDPAAVASWTWTVARYPERLALLARLHDTAFRDEMTAIMMRRLAVARAIPLVVEYRARVSAGRPDADALLDELQNVRAEFARHPDALLVLDRFLAAAKVAPPPR
jgi:hypothetical protein